MIVKRPTRRHRQTHRLAIAILAIPAVLTTACAGANTESPEGYRPTVAGASGRPATTPTSSSEPPSSQSNSEEPDTLTTIRITVGSQTITAQLADNPTAQDLASQLPLNLSIGDFNRVEKIADLPRPLTTDGVPAGDDPEVNDIGYYAPSNNLVFYYGDVGYFNGIVRIGRAGGQDMQLIERQRDGTQITVERA
jgi:hypothetical protein